MRRLLSALLAASSIFGGVHSATAARRPRYGGRLRVEIQGGGASLEPAILPGGAEPLGITNLRGLIYDRLVRLDQHGRPQAALAISWERDKSGARWRFRIRPGVKWHDGAPLSPDQIATSLQDSPLGGHVQWKGDALDIALEEPLPDLPILLAVDPNMLIRRKEASENSLPVGTGPFRLVEWRSGTRAVLQANEDYWEGRPYLDGIEVVMGRSSRDQLLDWEVDKADLFQLDPPEARRAQQERKQVWTSSPVDLLSLQFNLAKTPAQDERLREAVALAIDRESIHRVILQNYGESAGSLFPQWLSGYAFLFSTTPDLDRSRKKSAEISKLPTIKAGYDPSDSVARQVMERVAVNTRDAGIQVEPTPLPPNWKTIADDGMDLRVIRTHISGPTFSEAVREASAAIGFPRQAKLDPEEVYNAEKQFLGEYARVPLVYVPALMGIGSRVEGWSATPWSGWRLENVWLKAAKP